MMLRRFDGSILALAVVLATMPALSAAREPPIGSSAYRLIVPQPDSYRLARPCMPVPLAAPSAIDTTYTSLADRPFATHIHTAARNANLDPALVHAIISVESGYNPTARSPKGAIGLMQVMPETAARYGISATAVRSLQGNLFAGTRYLKDLMSQFNSQLDLVLAAYNAGEFAVLRYGSRIPPYRETQLYVPAVLARYKQWQVQQYPGASLPIKQVNNAVAVSARFGTLCQAAQAQPEAIEPDRPEI